MHQRDGGQGMRVFLLVWLGQLISLLGSGVAGFALGIWVYQQTGSVTQFALMSMFAALPSVVISPLAGALVDRWDRRSVMLLSDLGAGLAQGAIALLYYLGWLEIWQIYLAIVISSTCNAFQWPAFSAATTLLVPKQQLARASGMVQTAQGIAQILAPALGGVLVLWLGLTGVLLIDAVTFLFSFAILVLVRFPRLPAPATSAERQSIWKEAAQGWIYIGQRPGLLALLLLFALINFNVGIVTVLVTPLGLAFTTPAVLGSILSMAGVGLLLGSVLMSIWGGPRRRVNAILGFYLLTAASLVLVGLRPSIPVFYVSAFCFFFGVPFIGGSSQAIWQVKVPPELQGRVFAMRRVIAWSVLPLAYLVAGPLADGVFGPLLLEGGALAGSVGRIIGVGPGYGIALLFLALGLLILLVTVAGYGYPRLRLVEDELPDAIPDEPQAEPQPSLSRASEPAASDAAASA